MRRFVGPILVIFILLGPGPGSLTGSEPSQSDRDLPGRLLASMTDQSDLARVRGASDPEVAEIRSQRSRPGPAGIAVTLLLAVALARALRPADRLASPIETRFRRGPDRRRGPPRLQPSV